MAIEVVESKPHLARQSDLIPQEILSTPITIIGAGAIGSFVTLTLAKMGFENLSVWDFDNIEIHNLNSQFYRFSDIGHPKVFALQELVRDFTQTQIKANCGEYTDERFEGIVISAVDSMSVRKNIWDAHKMKGFETKFIIDPRMGAENATLYVINPVNAQEAENYEKTLFSDDDAFQEKCTAKATMYCAIMLSGLVTKTVKACLLGENNIKSLAWSIKQDDMILNGGYSPGLSGLRSGNDQGMDYDAARNAESWHIPQVRGPVLDTDSYRAEVAVERMDPPSAYQYIQTVTNRPTISRMDPPSAYQYIQTVTNRPTISRMDDLAESQRQINRVYAEINREAVEMARPSILPQPISGLATTLLNEESRINNRYNNIIRDPTIPF